MKLLIVGGDFVILITSSVVPSQAIGLPIVMMNKPSIMKSAHSILELLQLVVRKLSSPML